MKNPMPLKITLTHKAEKDLLAITSALRQQIKEDILCLSQDAIPFSQVKKLIGFSPNIWQLKSGDFRILYRKDSGILFILRIIPKPKQVRVLRSLK